MANKASLTVIALGAMMRGLVLRHRHSQSTRMTGAM